MNTYSTKQFTNIFGDNDAPQFVYIVTDPSKYEVIRFGERELKKQTIESVIEVAQISMDANERKQFLKKYADTDFIVERGCIEGTDLIVHVDC